MTTIALPSPSATLAERLETCTATVGVVGLGYVGLPLAMAFAEAGFNVCGVDVNGRRVDLLASGRSDIADVTSRRMKENLKSGRFRPTTRYSDLASCDAIVICVPTPLRKNRDPDLSCIVTATESILPIAKPGQCLVLESTTYPGTTREVVLPRLEERGFHVGRDYFLAFSPERTDPGNETFGISNTPKIVGGVTPTCTRLATALYSAVAEQVIQVSSPEAAEMAKLLENTFRAVNIGLVNELALLCERLQLDVWEVIRAAATKPFGFMPFVPGPGIGGHCIPIDPLYLSWRVRGMDLKTRFIDIADEVNRAMPAHVAASVADLLNEHARAVRGSTILLLGVAYKRDVGDTRESPAIDVARLLGERGAHLAYFDPHVEAFHADGFLVPRIARLDAGTLRAFDAVVILADHGCIDYQLVLEESSLVFDARNTTASRSGKALVRRLGSGVEQLHAQSRPSV